MGPGDAPGSLFLTASIRFGADGPVKAPPFETVAEAVFRRYAQVWKPQTLYVNRSCYRRALAPWFAGRPITDIDCQDIERWAASLRATPVSADRSMPILSVILTEAERMGVRPEGSNPCRGIRRWAEVVGDTIALARRQDRPEEGGPRCEGPAHPPKPLHVPRSPPPHHRAVISTPMVCSGEAASLSRRVALKPKARSGALGADVHRQPRL